MKINILSPGRFHVCDLARELDRCGHDVRFYSYVPAKRTEEFGLPRRCSHSLYLWMAPFLYLERKLFRDYRLFKHLSLFAQDFLTGLVMRRSDVTIAMSGAFLHSLKKAKAQGAVVLLERGSKHTLEQRRILEAIPSMVGKVPVPSLHVNRDLEGYRLADHIVIASDHVRQSFLKHGVEESKLFVNPYGVSLGTFQPQPEVTKEYDVILVGGWSYRKGCDLVAEALANTKYRVLHVGGLVDLPFPDCENFTHVDPVNEPALVDYYAKAKVFLLASREEGLALVQAQALACGLPLVCSQDTGGRDLGVLTGYRERIFEMESFTVEALMASLELALEFQQSGPVSAMNLDSLSWAAYGRRYDAFLREVVKG